ncbi:hypothetical protein JIR23_22140 [Bradyrhizobium diazoefficiens]|nr:hypothetical protein [Bradyrhizobium diazoefficiens]QQN62281.1 hypothetical protein JIR23_22140 [Bradyrhizobium diazoefficiens]
MAGPIAELARFILARDFRNIDPSSARVILVETVPACFEQYGRNLTAVDVEPKGCCWN